MFLVFYYWDCFFSVVGGRTVHGDDNRPTFDGLSDYVINNIIEEQKAVCMRTVFCFAFFPGLFWLYHFSESLNICWVTMCKTTGCGSREGTDDIV